MQKKYREVIKMKFYFAGAIRGGRDRLDVYIKINELLEKYGEVLDKHVASPNVDKIEENNSLEEIYIRDVNWIKDCDILVAEVSTPSLGVGYEIAYAERLEKRIICLYDSNINISAMISGNNNFELISYQNINELLNKLEDKLK
jgi:nucleoside 2-deoxyribosyltransferase